MPEILYQALPVIVSIILLVYLFLLLRAGRIRDRYAYLWMLLGVGMLALSVWPQAAFYVAEFLGFQTPANLLLASCSLLLLVTAINTSTAVSKLEEDRRRLVEETALLDERVRRLELKPKIDSEQSES